MSSENAFSNRTQECDTIDGIPVVSHKFQCGWKEEVNDTPIALPSVASYSESRPDDDSLTCLKFMRKNGQVKTNFKLLEEQEGDASMLKVSVEGDESMLKVSDDPLVNEIYKEVFGFTRPTFIVGEDGVPKMPAVEFVENLKTLAVEASGNDGSMVMSKIKDIREEMRQSQLKSIMEDLKEHPELGFVADDEDNVHF
eukprot:gnl/MRDRNA2_/MRDRNA2_85915_c0_seq1.p1 gnl/MRDRNA2_/MRDRNA2_85915_c0~~gnl/MRDRNA2_/MRDRNA2_85915_c0_seq1.p1  ORF type:complete len:197 (+),score=52.74 gnl/MRDRNA2_/MRDRNA2_85915_c0_seq1:102-692(+)